MTMCIFIACVFGVIGLGYTSLTLLTIKTMGVNGPFLLRHVLMAMTEGQECEQVQLCRAF